MTPSLVLGGYDASKLVPAQNTSFGIESYGQLLVNLQSITTETASNSTLLPLNLTAKLDSGLSEIWLPPVACNLFENVFGIEFNSEVQRYLVNETLHNQLLSENASVSFSLLTGPSQPYTVNISLPYASFDLVLASQDLQPGSPIPNRTQRYFPLRRGDSPDTTTYTLGRTFLQEA